MKLDIASVVPKVDPIEQFVQGEMKRAMNQATEEILHDYKRDHLLSRGAPVGEA